MLSDQLAVLNADFAPHDIAFNLLGTDRIINAGWAVDNNEIAMKTALRKGGYGDLNVYFQVRLMKNFLGYAQLPGPITPGSFAFIRDGVSLNAQTVPGGSQATFNLGKTATHEVGHWLGLYHTFNGNSCTGPGDLVDDTPVQAGYSTGCPIGRDSCPNHPGLDPIHNYMDYTDEYVANTRFNGENANSRCLVLATRSSLLGRRLACTAFGTRTVLKQIAWVRFL